VWNDIWKWLYGNYIFHTAVIVAVVYLVFFPGRLHRVFRIFRKMKIGPFELQAGDEIDPNTPCPYKKSRDESFNAIRSVDGKVDKLSAEMQEVMAIVKNMSIDQQKTSFYNKEQPDAERLVAGLKYIHQGGNGQTKPDVIIFAKEHKDLYDAFTKLKPELRLIH